MNEVAELRARAFHRQYLHPNRSCTHEGTAHAEVRRRVPRVEGRRPADRGGGL